MSVNDVVTVAAPILQAVSIAVTAGFAIGGLNAWRRQLVGKRRIEIAEETLVAAYKVRDAFTYFRSSGTYTTEGQSRPNREGEPTSVRSMRDTYFVPLERMQATSEAFAQFSKAAILCEAYFGPATATPFHAILRARNRVIVSARMLLNAVGQPGYERMDPKLRERWEGNIWEGAQDPDEIARTVAQALQEIEGMCRPQLGGRGGRWQWWSNCRSNVVTLMTRLRLRKAPRAGAAER